MIRDRIKRLFEIDARSLAIFRIGLGTILLYDWISRSLDFISHYTDYGILPRASLLEKAVNVSRFSIFFCTDNYFLTALFFAFGMLSALALIVGYRTRFAIVISWILLVSIQIRNPLLLQGGDDLLRMLTFWSMFLPLASRYSVDNALHPEKFSWSNSSLSVASAALLLQVAIMYCSTGVLKSGIPWRVDFSAITYTLHLDAFARPTAVFLRKFPEICRILTASIVYFEVFGPLLFFMPLFFIPFRIFSILSFFGLQLGLVSCLRLGHFPFVSTLGIIPFIPSEIWAWLYPKCQIKFNKCSQFTKNLLIRITSSVRYGWLFKYQINFYRPRWITQLVVLNLLGLVVLWNFNNCKPWYFPNSQRQLVYLLYLDQNWSMFAPRPLDTNGWYNITGKLANGTSVVVDHTTLTPIVNTPVEQNNFYGRERWRKYFLSLATATDGSNYVLYGRYLCRLWNTSQLDPNQLLATFEINFHSELIQASGFKEPMKTRKIWAHRCF